MILNYLLKDVYMYISVGVYVLIIKIGMFFSEIMSIVLHSQWGQNFELFLL